MARRFRLTRKLIRNEAVFWRQSASFCLQILVAGIPRRTASSAGRRTVMVVEFVLCMYGSMYARDLGKDALLYQFDVLLYNECRRTKRTYNYVCKRLQLLNGPSHIVARSLGQIPNSSISCQRGGANTLHFFEDRGIPNPFSFSSTACSL